MRSRALSRQFGLWPVGLVAICALVYIIIPWRLVQRSRLIDARLYSGHPLDERNIWKRVDKKERHNLHKRPKVLSGTLHNTSLLAKGGGKLPDTGIVRRDFRRNADRKERHLPLKRPAVSSGTVFNTSLVAKGRVGLTDKKKLDRGIWRTNTNEKRPRNNLIGKSVRVLGRTRINTSLVVGDQGGRFADLKVIHKEHEPKQSCLRQVHIWSNELLAKGEHPCPGLACGVKLVVDTSYHTLQSSHAVVLLARTQWDWAEMFLHRPPGQKWIFYSQESAINTWEGVVPPEGREQDTYDYIMSYRHAASQLYGGFGLFDTAQAIVPKDHSRNWAIGRTRQVAWLASNCFSDTWLHWNRTGFVKELSKLLDVGMYGKCGNPNACGNTQDGSDSCGSVLKKFKFYLALENSPCRDYITEKLWSNAYLNDLVPIVYGPPRSDYEAVAPPGSFIHVQDFQNIRDLADYITLLDNNDHLFNEFFKWKKTGVVRATPESWLLGPKQMCQVVSKLYQDERAVKSGTYHAPVFPDWKTWWTLSCPNVPQFPIDINI